MKHMYLCLKKITLIDKDKVWRADSMMKTNKGGNVILWMCLDEVEDTLKKYKCVNKDIE